MTRTCDPLDGRLMDVESWVRVSSADERVAAVRWIERTLARPPFDRIDHPAASLLYLLARDLRAATDDPAAVVIEGVGVIPEPHHLMDVPLPDDDEPAPSDTSADELRHVLGGVFAR